jgi:hypothetical protein
LPDGLLKNQKFHFWYILESLGLENFAVIYGLFGISYGHLEYVDKYI